jgi:hypothetical protein
MRCGFTRIFAENIAVQTGSAGGKERGSDGRTVVKPAQELVAGRRIADTR